MTDIHVRIDELVLHGVSAADRHRIEDAVRKHLAGALAVPGVLGELGRTGASLERLVLPAIGLSRRADRLGANIADALVQGLARLGAPDHAQAPVPRQPSARTGTLDASAQPAVPPETA